MKMMNLEYFWIVMYIWWLLKLWVFFVWKAYQHSLASINNKKPKNFNKTAACSPHCPLRHPAPSLGHWYTGVYLFCGKLTKPCRHARTFQLVSQHSLASTNNKKPQNFNKPAACSHHCPLRHPAQSLGHWYTGVYLRIFDSGPSNPTTFLGLCSPGDYRQSIQSPMGVPIFYRKGAYIHYLWLYSENTAKKGVLFDES